MKRLIPLGVLAAAILVPAAIAAPKATHTFRGTVVGKDRAHHGLVVALPGGGVQTFVAPSVFARTDVGGKVVVSFAPVAGKLPLALSVRLTGHASRAVVHGTIIRLAKRRAIINAGGTALRVTLHAPRTKRTLASANGGPQVGDTVTADVEIAGDGTLAASAVVVAPTTTTPQAGSDGEMEVRGTVTALTATSITVTTGSKVDVPCTIPDGVTLSVKLNDVIELKCDLIGTVWTVHVARGEDDQSDQGDQGDGGSLGSVGATAGQPAGDGGSDESGDGDHGGSNGSGSSSGTGTFGNVH
jgi:hypothetical protein